MTNGSPIDVSIVISTWNNAGRLRRTLASLSSMVPPSDCVWEVVLVNNNCTDDTPAVAASFSDRLPLRYYTEPRKGVSYGRNKAVGEAAGPWLLFTDDDVLVPQHWLGNYWRWMKTLGPGYLIGGPVRSAFEGRKPSEELLQYAPWSVQGLFLGPEAKELSGRQVYLAANWACARSAVLDVGGFKSDRGLFGGERRLLLGEETDLMLRLVGAGFRRWYSPDLELSHLVPAAKASLRHVAWRAAAVEYASTIQRRGRPEGIYWFGAPRWEYRLLLKAMATFCWSVLRRDRIVEAYIQVARTRARIEGWRHKMSERAAPGTAEPLGPQDGA